LKKVKLIIGVQLPVIGFLYLAKDVKAISHIR